MIFHINLDKYSRTLYNSLKTNGGNLMFKVIQTDKAPAAIGPYSQALMHGNFLFASGQIPINPGDGQIVEGDIKVQALQVMKNVSAILEAAGASFENVIKTTCFLKNMDDFAAFNEVYAQYFTGKPARSCVAAAKLPRDVLCEVEITAIVE
jgi:2-iminobutanoate/2-iminopropanoate deaminase